MEASKTATARTAMAVVCDDDDLSRKQNSNIDYKCLEAKCWHTETAKVCVCVCVCVCLRVCVFVCVCACVCVWF